VHRPGSAAYNGDIFIAFAIDNYSNPGGGTKAGNSFSSLLPKEIQV
jgi:hypothetical protein